MVGRDGSDTAVLYFRSLQFRFKGPAATANRWYQRRNRVFHVWHERCFSCHGRPAWGKL